MRDDLLQFFISGLEGRIRGLIESLGGLERGVPESEASLRRIAHSLKGSGGTYGFPEISEAAARAEKAETPDLAARTKELIELLEKTTRTHLDTGARRRILVIEDDHDQARFIATLLAAPDRDIVVAADMAAARAAIEEAAPTLVILDLFLPDADGRQLLMRLRREPATAGIPIVVTTARGGDATRTECLALGANAFFEKPVEETVFSITVSNLLREAFLQERELRRDLLTGIPNRAAFIEAFDRARAMARRSGEPFAVAILDLDRFKNVNDTYGHATGDLVLKGAAATIEKTLRKSDLLARWGGEEFVALLPETDAARGAKALEGALLAMRARTFHAEDGRSFPVTFSAGVIEVKEEMSADEAVAAADLLLYRAKEAGRNRIVHDAALDAEAPVAKARIILVEDDATIASLVIHRLGKEGFEVIHFADPCEAIVKIESMDARLVILDIQMPCMDGFTFFKQMRAMPDLASTPVLLLTSLGSEKDIVKGFELGAGDYVVKPFSPGELAARARRLLRAG
jgi:diguanylate cyclase (GGDEF)-like protein